MASSKFPAGNDKSGSAYRKARAKTKRALHRLVPALVAVFGLWVEARPTIAVQDARQTPQSQSLAQPNPESLQTGKTIHKEIGARETHAYTIEIAAGQVIEGVLEQGPLDLTASLLTPDGTPAAEFDGRWYGPEPIFFETTIGGAYRLEIKPRNPSSPRGAYQLVVESLRAGTAEDAVRLAAVKSSTEGKRLIAKGDATSLKLAQERYLQALDLWRGLSDRSAEAQTLHSLGFVSGFLAGPAKAIEYYEQALTIRRSIRDLEGEGESLSNLAASVSAAGDKQRALGIYEEALPIRRTVGNRSGEATTLGNIGAIYLYLGETAKAIEYYQRSLPLWRDAGHVIGEASAHIGLGSIFSLLGERQQAFDSLHQALALSRGAGDRRGEAYALYQLSRLYEEIGDHTKAIENGERALTLFRAVADRFGEGNTLNHLGVVHNALTERRRAVELFDQALIIWRASRERYGEANTLLNLGRLSEENGDQALAFERYTESLKLFQTLKNPRGQAIALTRLGAHFLAKGERETALDHYNRALPLWREIGDRSGEAAALANLARAERESGKLDQARASIESALLIVEKLRGKLANPKLRDSYLAATQSYHELSIDLLMRLHERRPSEGYDGLALAASENARARGLLETLAETQAGVDAGTGGALSERRRVLRERINARAEYQDRLLREKPSREQIEAVKRELSALLDEAQEVETQIRTANPKYGQLDSPQPLKAAEIQRLLDPDTLLLEYALGEERSYLWTVTPSAIKSFALPKRAEIESLAREAYGLLSSAEPKSSAAQPESVAALARVLLEPVADLLGRKRLVVVADGALLYLPFAALPSPGSAANPLILEHEIVSLPSASSLAALRREIAGRARAPKAAAVLADPVFEPDDVRLKKGALDEGALSKLSQRPSVVLRSGEESGAGPRFARLLFSRREAETIIALGGRANSLKALDFEANRATAMSPALRDYRVIHFAAHALLNNLHPELSGIVLSLVDERGRPQDGFLRLHDIYNLRLGADLVVLGACQTALGKEIRGEGLVGLTRGFMYAGAPRVTASLWKVDDRATEELMKEFYRRMLGDGLRPAAALRAAQITLLQQKRWAAPHAWAGFVFQGEWN
jgi:CHAT domain-containing protein